MSWYRFDSGKQRVTLTVHVQPRAVASAVVGVHGDALKIRVAAPPLDDRANAELVHFLSRVLDVGPSRISLMSGARSRRKVVAVSAADAALLRRLEELARD